MSYSPSNIICEYQENNPRRSK